MSQLGVKTGKAQREQDFRSTLSPVSGPDKFRIGNFAVIGGIGACFSSGRRCVVSKNVVAIFHRQMAGEASLVQRIVARFAVREVGVPQPPDAAYFFESFTMN